MKSILVQDFLSTATFVAALGCGLIAGVFFTFSTFVMKALVRLPAEQGIAAMQSINVFAVKSWFLVVFLGTAAACGFVVVSSLSQWSETSSMLLIGGGASFLPGCFLVTILFNVPMNALAAMPVDDSNRATKWVDYVRKWTRWNHLRTIASLAAATLLFAGWADDRKHHNLSPDPDRPAATNPK